MQITRARKEVLFATLMLGAFLWLVVNLRLEPSAHSISRCDLVARSQIPPPPHPLPVLLLTLTLLPALLVHSVLFARGELLSASGGDSTLMKAF